MPPTGAILVNVDSTRNEHNIDVETSRRFRPGRQFTVGAVEFLAIDVAIAAMARGDWSAFERDWQRDWRAARAARPARSQADAIEARGHRVPL